MERMLLPASLGWEEMGGCLAPTLPPMGRECLGRTRCLGGECLVVENPTCVGTHRNTCVSLRGLLFSSYNVETCVYSESYVDTASSSMSSQGHQAVTQSRWWWYEEEKGCCLIFPFPVSPTSSPCSIPHIPHCHPHDPISYSYPPSPISQFSPTPIPALYSPSESPSPPPHPHVPLPHISHPCPHAPIFPFPISPTLIFIFPFPI
jgi:hypothetical protein